MHLYVYHFSPIPIFVRRVDSFCVCGRLGQCLCELPTVGTYSYSCSQYFFMITLFIVYPSECSCTVSAPTAFAVDGGSAYVSVTYCIRISIRISNMFSSKLVHKTTNFEYFCISLIVVPILMFGLTRNP